MSDQGDPFERNNKTVLRLNPGGRRPVAAPPNPSVVPAAPPYQPPPQTPYPQAGWPQSSPPISPPPISPPPGPAPGSYSGGGYPAAAPAQVPGQNDAWFTPPPAPPPASSGTGGALILKRDVPVAANANLLLEAAGPLLLLLGRLRTSLMSANFANLMEQVADAVEEFDKSMRAESVPSAVADEAKYVICATCDDIVQNIPSEQRHVWAQYSMLSRFFGERTGGVRFFEKLDKAKQDPVTNYDLLELIYACLAIGFQGIHRTTAGGAATLQGIHRNTYELLRRARPRSREDLSPHWRGQALPQSGATFRIPFWALSAVAAAALFGVFVTLRILLSGNTEVVTAEMGRMFPDTQLGIERAAVAVPAPPVPVKASTQLERIRAKLKAEIDQNKVDPVESGQSIIIRVGAFALFDSGQATVRPDFEPVAVKIAEALEAEPGDIRITGHTDNVRIATARFPSNFELSVERANAVASILKGKLSRPDRLKTEGKGEAAPLTSNQTPEGRGRNRRVDISIPREDTLKTAAR
jgi:type VI secretion system protein ImpK